MLEFFKKDKKFLSDINTLPFTIESKLENN
jgi:hypothetical protein